MNAHAIQQFSQVLNPLFALALIVCGVRQLRNSALLWFFCVALSVGVAQQISKIVQHFRWLGENFPSTHFAVALALAGAFWALNRRFVPATLIYLAVYAGLILWQNYHTPLDLVGAVYAAPLGFYGGRFATRFGTRRRRITSN
jgi:membrane-associated phospholipid phosphatase